ncbi:MAG TPA: glucan biosynthesis protein [Geminicoccaceae bacterium]
MAGAAALVPALMLARAYAQAQNGNQAAEGAPAAPAAPDTMRFGPPEPFDPKSVEQRARDLAAAPYAPPGADFPPVLAELNYDQHRDIRFRTDHSLWHDRKIDAEVQFFHLGYGFRQPVHMYEVADGQQREILYDPALFDYGKNTFEVNFSEHLGFAGFRLHVPLNRPDYLDELVVFLGASYFRALGRGQRYGLSARGIAINTGLPSGEEFPIFRAFWLERPKPGDERLTVHALLDGPSLAGAFHFQIRPGATTVMHVQNILFPRRTIDLLGVAPLTSMYLFGAADRQEVDDFRPEVHDSEGLQIWSGANEWIWRPLVNPRTFRLSLYRDDNPRGFGLLQRNRDFDSYQDLESRYELRPSLWVEPRGRWGQGHVRLIELPTSEEVNDNVVAFWSPAQPIEAGSEHSFIYRLHWCTSPPERPDLGQVVETRIGAGGVPGLDYGDSDRRKFVIDFAGAQLTDLPADAPIKAVVNLSKGSITQPVVQKNEVTEGFRLFFDYMPEDGGPVEFRAHLEHESNVLTEIWSFQWTA